jgi:hypothetical protein
MDGIEFNSDTGELNFKLPNQIPEGFWRAAQEVTAYQLPDGGGLALKIKMHPKLQALKMEYDRHKLTGQDGNVNNFAIGHVTQLQVNANRRRAGLPVDEE